MTITKKNVVSKHRNGDKWIVSYYSPRYKTFIESDSLEYNRACEVAKNIRNDWNTAKQEYNNTLNNN